MPDCYVFGAVAGRAASQRTATEPRCPVRRAYASNLDRQSPVAILTVQSPAGPHPLAGGLAAGSGAAAQRLQPTGILPTIGTRGNAGHLDLFHNIILRF